MWRLLATAGSGWVIVPLSEWPREFQFWCLSASGLGQFTRQMASGARCSGAGAGLLVCGAGTCRIPGQVLVHW